MIQQELRKHQWKAFGRHPMFDRNLALKVFMYIVFAMFGAQMLSFGFLLNELMSEVGTYTHAIDSFNYFLLYVLLFDFTIKYLMKQSQSMQIAPYLTLPIRRNTLFNFLLMKEFSNIWNLYLLFMIVPFSFMAVTPHYGFLTALLYILFVYLLCVLSSLLVNVANNLLKRSGWFFFLPLIGVAAVWAVCVFTPLPVGDYTVVFGEWILGKKLLAWGAVVLAGVALWILNQRMMRGELYRAMQGKKISEGRLSSFRLPLIDRLGAAGEFINLEIKMIMRSKRLKMQMYMGIFFIVYYYLMISSRPFQEQYFFVLFFTFFVVAWGGLIMAQYMFTAESSFFDGLMTRNLSLFEMMRGKYILYSGVAFLTLLALMPLVFLRKVDFLFLVSAFFYAIGFLFFLMFQNAVYNKSYFDHSESGLFNWKGTSGNMILVSMIGMFIPIGLVMVVKGVFNASIATYFMLATGLTFTCTVNLWLKWTYGRFLKRRYKNMEGFRSNS